MNGWRSRIDSVTERITGNALVRSVMGIVDSANGAGATLFAAALAFDTMFTTVPLLLLLSGVLGWLVADPLQRAALLAQLVSYFPPLANVLEASLDGVVRERGALSIVGLVGLLWASSSLYGALDEVMRRLFPGGGLRGEVSRRVRGVITVLIMVALFAGTVSLGGVWAFLGRLVGGIAMLSYVALPIALVGMVVVVLAVYLLVPTRPPSRQAALVPAIVAGVGIGLLTNVFSLVAPWLIGGLSGFGVVATVFGAFVWLNLSFQILLYGAAWARLRRDREDALVAVDQP